MGTSRSPEVEGKYGYSGSRPLSTKITTPRWWGNKGSQDQGPVDYVSAKTRVRNADRVLREQHRCQVQKKAIHRGTTA
jgi:hypothetical protein